MAIKIAITNAKGGVAKTTTAINIADALTFMGYKVLFIDMDPQGNSSSVYTGTLVREDTEKTLKDIFEKKEDVRNCITHTKMGDIILTDKSLAEQDTVYQVQIGGTKILKKALAPVENDYDFMIMDTPPSVGAFMQNALIAADGCVCPINPKKFAVDGLYLLLDKIEQIKENENPDLKIYGIVLTMYDQRNAQDKGIYQQLPDLGEEIGFHVFNTPIRTCQDIEKAIANSESLFRERGNSNGAKDYANLVGEILTEINNE